MKFAEGFIVQRKDGRVSRVMAIGRDGTYLCDIPCTDIGFTQSATGPSLFTFTVHGERAAVIDDTNYPERPTEPMAIVPRLGTSDDPHA